MSSDGKDEKLAQFQDVTGTDGQRATFFLESANWDLEMALGSFYENEGGGGGAEQDEPMETGTAAAATASGETRSAAPSGAAAAAAPIEPEMSKPRRSGGGVGANVGTLYSGRQDSDESDGDDDDEDEGQAFYAGGSSTSGQQILGPPKKKGSSEKFVKDLFKKAREHGAEAVDPSTSKAGGSKGGASAFTGTGFKLGSSDSDPTEKVEGAQKPKPPREFVLKMWKNGFSIDDGELRPYNDPENRAFLAAVMTGRIPDELVHMAEGGEVHVDMEDHKEEEYAKPKGARKAFTGSGHVLGGITPGVQEDSFSGVGAAVVAGPDAEKNAQTGLGLKENEPTTSVQIRLPDGKRLVAKVNHTHTVGDLRNYVSVARPDLAASDFGLHTTYPPKELSDTNLTVKDAGLIGAAIMVRRK